MEPLTELEEAYGEARTDPSFRTDLGILLRDFVGRPTPLTRATGLSRTLGLSLYLKREDLCHTGAHKINNAAGQGLLAKRMRKTRIVAETGAGQHGVAAATICALLGLECVVYMGVDDMARQAPNVERMKLLGASVIGVDSGSRTLKDAINEALRDWVTNVHNTHYLLGSVLGPHRDFHRVIGQEARAQILSQTGKLPDMLVACVGGGSNAIGLFHAFLDDPVGMVGVEAGGRSTRAGDHSARFLDPPALPGVLQGTKTYLLDAFGGRGTGLSGARPGALVAARPRPDPVHVGGRRRGGRCLPPLRTRGGHPAGPRVGPRARLRDS
jgi:tryptophan synthase beta subunit